MYSAVIVFPAILLVCLAAPQNYQTTPVPILKQINRHNDDGSYSFGFEAADGTFKIETKYATGEVFGKYGYVGDDGKLRVVEYGASKRGFEPKGSDINVAPPTISNSLDEEEVNPNYDDGEYREDPSIYDRVVSPPANVFPASSFKSAYQGPARQTQFYQPRFGQAQPRYTTPPPLPRFLPQSSPHFHPQLTRDINLSKFQPQPNRIIYDPSIFTGHPATNIDINTGSFTVSYTT